MTTSMIADLGSLSFWRIAAVPFDTYVAALDSWLPAGHGSELWFGGISCSLRWSMTATWAHAGSRSASPGDRLPAAADAAGHRPLVRIVHRAGAHPEQAGAAHSRLFPGRTSPA